MIFAAGRGTRMRHLTATRPKPMIELGGIRLIDRAIGHGVRAGCAPIVANVHHLADVISPHLLSSQVLVSDETQNLLDTGGGLRKARPLLGGNPVFTLNPDGLWLGPNPLTTLEGGWRGSGALLLLAKADKAHARAGPGDFASDSTGALERTGDLIYTGAQLIEISILDEFHEEPFSLNEVWDRLAQRDLLHGVIYPGEWCDVGSPEALGIAENLLSSAERA